MYNATATNMPQYIQALTFPQTSNNILAALDKRIEIHTVHLDFSKAFDEVSHDLLLHKLKHRGSSGL